MKTKTIAGRWTGKFKILAGLASQAGTLDITVADDGTFNGTGVDNWKPIVVTGCFEGSDHDDQSSHFEMGKFLDMRYSGYALPMEDGGIQMAGGAPPGMSFEATLYRAAPDTASVGE